MNERHNWLYKSWTRTYECVGVAVCHLQHALKTRPNFTCAGCPKVVTARGLAAATVWLPLEINQALDDLANAPPAESGLTIEEVLAEIVRPSGLIVPQGDYDEDHR